MKDIQVSAKNEQPPLNFARKMTSIRAMTIRKEQYATVHRRTRHSPEVATFMSTLPCSIYALLNSFRRGQLALRTASG